MKAASGGVGFLITRQIVERFATGLEPNLFEFPHHFQSALHADFAVNAFDIAVQRVARPAKLTGHELFRFRSFQRLANLPLAVGEVVEWGSQGVAIILRDKQALQRGMEQIKDTFNAWHVRDDFLRCHVPVDGDAQSEEKLPSLRRQTEAWGYRRKLLAPKRRSSRRRDREQRCHPIASPSNEHDPPSARCLWLPAEPAIIPRRWTPMRWRRPNRVGRWIESRCFPHFPRNSSLKEFLFGLRPRLTVDADDCPRRRKLSLTYTGNSQIGEAQEPLEVVPVLHDFSPFMGNKSARFRLMRRYKEASICIASHATLTITPAAFSFGTPNGVFDAWDHSRMQDALAARVGLRKRDSMGLLEDSVMKTNAKGVSRRGFLKVSAGVGAAVAAGGRKDDRTLLWAGRRGQ